MKKYKIARCIIVAFLQMWCFDVSAQLSIGAAGGVASRWSFPSRIGALGTGPSFSFKYRMWKGLVTGIDYEYYRFGPDAKPSGNVNYKIAYHGYKAAIEYHLGKKKFKPYAGVSLGIFNYRTLTTIDFGAFGKQELLKNEYYFGIAPVIGANYPISARVGVNANIKLNAVFIKQAAPIGYGALSLGIYYNIIK